MPVNLELKIRVTSHKKFENILKSNAELKAALKQKDVYYKVKSGLLKLRIEGNTYTLIKYLRDESGKRWSNYELLTLTGNDPEKYLAGIFEINTIVSKTRKVYIFKNTRIHLDKVKELGNFLELETLLVTNRSDAIQEFHEVKKMLNIESVEEIRLSYKNLIEAK